METFRSLGRDRLDVLCSAVGFDLPAATGAFDTLIEPWGDRPIGARPRWPSDIADDHTPFELSLGVEAGRMDPRFLVEAQGEQPTLAAAWRAGLATNRRLRERYAVSLERADLVQDLFEPATREGRFAMWHACWLRAGAPPLFKIYYDPAARGPAAAPAVIEAALHRLGLARAWRFMARTMARSPKTDRLIYFSLDLDDAEARVKIYLAHPGARAGDIEPLLAASPDHRLGDAERFCRAMTGGVGPYRARPLLTCYSFVSGDDAEPTSVTLHLPLRCYVPDDRVALERIVAFVDPSGGAAYRDLMARFARRKLEDGVGMQTYASFRRHGDRVRLTVYLALEAYAVQPARHASVRAARR